MRFRSQFLLLLTSLLFGEISFSEEMDSLTLATAVARAIEKNPAIATFDADRRIAAANLITALTRPNPELATEIEDVLGSGDYRGFNAAIYNVGVSQLIETGKKRHWRGEVAKAEKRTQELQFEVVRRELISETGQRFVAVVSAQEIEKNARENFKIAEEAFNTIKKQIEVGRGSAVDSGQALLGKNEALLLYESAKRENFLSRQQLSVMWAEGVPDFSGVSGNLLKPSSQFPSLETLNQSLESHPALELAKSGVSVASSELTLEERNRNPDVTLGLGYRRDSIVDDNALVLGFSLPIPIFDRNEGNITRAGAEIDKQKALVGKTRTQLEMLTAQSRSRLSAALTEYDLVSGDMLSAAEAHYKTMNEGLALGRIKYLDLLEARRSLNAVRKNKIEAVGRYHAARVELESLTGEKFQ